MVPVGERTRIAYLGAGPEGIYGRVVELTSGKDLFFDISGAGRGRCRGGNVHPVHASFPGGAHLVVTATAGSTSGA